MWLAARCDAVDALAAGYGLSLGSGLGLGLGSGLGFGLGLRNPSPSPSPNPNPNPDQVCRWSSPERLLATHSASSAASAAGSASSAAGSLYLADGTVCPSDPAGCTDGSVYFGGCVSGAVPVAVPPTSRTDDPPPTPTLTAPSSIGSCSPLRLSARTATAVASFEWSLPGASLASSDAADAAADDDMAPLRAALDAANAAADAQG